jgi:iron(III) transport system permease protein
MSVKAPAPAAPTATDGGAPARVSRLRWLTQSGVLMPVVLLALGLFTVVPLGTVLFRAFWQGGSFNASAPFEAFSLPGLPTVLRNTLILVIASSVLAVILATFFAWMNERSDASIGVLGSLMPVLPLATPAVAVSIGWTMLASPRSGFIGNVLENMGLGWLGDKINIFSWPGLIMIFTIELVPFAYAVIAAAFRNVDRSLEEAARDSGAGLFRSFWTISFPAIRPAVLSAFILSAIASFGFYATPSIIGISAGIDVLSVRIVRMLILEFPPHPDVAISLGAFSFVVVLILWIIQQRVVARGKFAAVGGRLSSNTPTPTGGWKWPLRLCLFGYFFVTSVMPLFALGLVSFQPFWSGQVDVSNLSFDHYLEAFGEGTRTRSAIVNSMQLGLFGGFGFVLLLAILVIAVRLRGAGPLRTFGTFSMLPAAASHIVLGLGVVVLFSGPPFNLAGTRWIVLLAYCLIYLPQASVAVQGARTQVGDDLVEASLVAGATARRTAFRVVLPLMIPGLVLAWAIVFILFVGEVTGSSLLQTAARPLIGPLLLNMFSQSNFGVMSALGFAISVLSGLVVLGIFTLGRSRARTRATATLGAIGSATSGP